MKSSLKLVAGHVLVLSAAAKGGKTKFLSQIARDLAGDALSVVFVDLERGAKALRADFDGTGVRWRLFSAPVSLQDVLEGIVPQTFDVLVLDYADLLDWEDSSRFVDALRAFAEVRDCIVVTATQGGLPKL